MKTNSLFSRFWIRLVFYYFGCLIFFCYPKRIVVYVYILMLLAFSFIDGKTGTKRSFLYTMIPVLYVALISFVFVPFLRLDLPITKRLFRGRFGIIILTFVILGPEFCIRAVFPMEHSVFDVMELTVLQFLIFALLEIGAFGLGYLWKNIFQKKDKN